MVASKIKNSDELFPSIAKLTAETVKQEAGHVEYVEQEKSGVRITPASSISSKPLDSDSSREQMKSKQGHRTRMM